MGMLLRRHRLEELRSKEAEAEMREVVQPKLAPEPEPLVQPEVKKTSAPKKLKEE